MTIEIIALFASHGPMTVREAMERGLGNLCNTCEANNARYRLNQLVSQGALRRRKITRTLYTPICLFPRQGKITVYQVAQS